MTLILSNQTRSSLCHFSVSDYWEGGVADLEQCSGGRRWGQRGGLKSSPESGDAVAYCENPTRWGSFRSITWAFFSKSDGAGKWVPGSEVICSWWSWPGPLWAGWRGAFLGSPRSQYSPHLLWLHRVWCGAPPAGFLRVTWRSQSPGPCPLSWLRFPWEKPTSEDVRRQEKLVMELVSVSLYDSFSSILELF